MKKIMPVIFIVLALVVGYYLYTSKPQKGTLLNVTSYEECVAAGYPIMESYPEQCATPEGRSFTRLIPSVAYATSTYGIAFEYLSTYVLTEKEVGDGHRYHYAIVIIDKKDVVLPVNGEGPTAITVDIYQNDLDKQALGGWLKNSSASNYKLSTGMVASSTVDGVSALAYTWSGLYQGETTAFLHKGNIVAVSVTYLTPDDDIRKVYQGLLNSLQLSDNEGVIPELM